MMGSPAREVAAPNADFVLTGIGTSSTPGDGGAIETDYFRGARGQRFLRQLGRLVAEGDDTIGYPEMDGATPDWSDEGVGVARDLETRSFVGA